MIGGAGRRLLKRLLSQPHLRDLWATAQAVPVAARPVLEAVCDMVAHSPEPQWYRLDAEIQGGLPLEYWVTRRMDALGTETEVSDSLARLARAGLIVRDGEALSLPPIAFATRTRAGAQGGRPQADIGRKLPNSPGRKPAWLSEERWQLCVTAYHAARKAQAERDETLFRAQLNLMLVLKGGKDIAAPPEAAFPDFISAAGNETGNEPGDGVSQNPNSHFPSFPEPSRGLSREEEAVVAASDLISKKNPSATTATAPSVIHASAGDSNPDFISRGNENGNGIGNAGVAPARCAHSMQPVSPALTEAERLAEFAARHFGWTSGSAAANAAPAIIGQFLAQGLNPSRVEAAVLARAQAKGVDPVRSPAWFEKNLPAALAKQRKEGLAAGQAAPTPSPPATKVTWHPGLPSGDWDRVPLERRSWVNHALHALDKPPEEGRRSARLVYDKCRWSFDFVARRRPELWALAGREDGAPAIADEAAA